MPTLLHTLFDAEQVLVDIHGYGLSTLELLSTILGMWSYVEIIRRRLRGPILGFCASLCLAAMFYQLRLYADMGLMVYYAAASVLTLACWQRNSSANEGLKVTTLSPNWRLALGLGAPALIGMLAFITGHLHIWLTNVFPEPTRFCYADATTTVLGITASLLLIRRKAECMAIWLAADIISTGIYIQSGAYFLAAVYALYALIDGTGLVVWLRRSRDEADAAGQILPKTPAPCINDLAEGV